MKKLVFLLLLVSSLFLPVLSFSENICFNEDTAKRMIVELEKTKNLGEQVQLYKEGTKELEYQILLLKQINSLQKEQVDRYKDLVDAQKKGYESLLKESKPNFFMEVMKAFGFIGIGVILGLVL